VEPLRCTSSVFRCPSTMCSSTCKQVDHTALGQLQQQLPCLSAAVVPGLQLVSAVSTTQIV
jgi:hypothetical protein